MKLLTTKQKQWLISRNIKENESYMFPRFGFSVYSEPDFINKEYIDTNPFTRSLDNERFLVKEKINGFCKGNFLYKPKGKDFYLKEEELSIRGLIETLFLLIISFISMVIYNYFKGNLKNE